MLVLCPGIDHLGRINIPLQVAINPLGPDGSYMIYGLYGRNNRPGAKGLTLIDQEWSINI